MPCRTCICISLLHKLILYHLEDQKLLLWNTLITLKCSWFFKLFSLFTYFVFAYYFFTTIFKTKENVISGDKDVNSSPYSLLAIKVGRRTFDSSHHIYLWRCRWAMELIATKLIISEAVTTDVPQKKCSEKSNKIHRKTITSKYKFSYW